MSEGVAWLAVAFGVGIVLMVYVHKRGPRGPHQWIMGTERQFTLGSLQFILPVLLVAMAAVIFINLTGLNRRGP